MVTPVFSVLSVCKVIITGLRGTSVAVKVLVDSRVTVKLTVEHSDIVLQSYYEF